MNSQVDEIFHKVVDLSSEERARYFSEHNLSQALWKEVEALVASDLGASRFLAGAISDIAGLAVSETEATGSRCGPFRLLALLGRGGMGEVYLAERIDGELNQQVAVKLLSRYADHPELRKRFLTERQILAKISHPNVARLLDAGHRDDGQPYFAMEYVEGQPIDVFSSNLETLDKVKLFLKVCSAVSYLHRNLVVHRDLKPNNIFVTAEGEPKVLDFGIAKMLDLPTDMTVTGMRILTPDYASPEQLAGEPVTTATDVYSLGAVLYRLLAGRSPHQFETAADGTALTMTPRRNITLPSKLLPSLKGDLEMITMKALRREPGERYATVEQLSDDLENYLESRPIRARRGDFSYRARKFLRRYRVPAAASVFVVASLSSGLYIANRQRAIAERRFEQLRHLSQKVIELDSAIRILPGSVDARRRLVAASVEYLEGLSREARGDLDLAQEIADGYWRLARIQGVNAEFNLGDPRKAEHSLQKADEAINVVLAAHPQDRNALFRSALIAHDRMILADTDERREQSLALTKKAIQQLEALGNNQSHQNPVRLEGFLRSGDPWEAERGAVAILYANIALTYVNEHLYADAERYAERSVEIVRPIPSAQDLVCSGLSVLANALRYQGNLEAALIKVREAKTLSERAHYPNETARFFSAYGPLLREGFILGERDGVSMGRFDQAAAVFQKALDLTEQAARKDANDAASRARLGTTARELGDVLRDKDPQRALAVFDLGLQRLGEVKSSVRSRRDRATLLAKSSYALRNLHRPVEAKRRIEEALELLRATKDYPSEHVLLSGHAFTVLCALADYEAEQGRTEESIAVSEKLLSSIDAGKPDVLGDLRDAPKMSRLYGSLTALYRKAGTTAKAEEMKSRRLQLWQHWQQKLPNNIFVLTELEAARRS